MLKYCSYFVLIFGLCAGDNLPQLKVGDTAPDFALPDHNGKTRRLSDYRGGLVVVYFFPRADTPGWTKQACSLRDNFSGFRKKNITVFGISYDSVASQKSFRDKYNLPFMLLSDQNHKVGKLYGVDKGLFTTRKTFLIREDGKIVKIYDNVSVTTHGEDILEYWRQYKTDSQQ